MAISTEDAAMLTAYFEALDIARSDLDKKWGVGRLEILCARIDPTLFARFRGQQQRWRSALEAAWKGEYLTLDALTLVEQKAGAMKRGWAALDARAEEAGERPLKPWVWEAKLDTGEVVAVVETDAEASDVIAEGRFVAVYTMREIAQLIEMIPKALQVAKVQFPGAKFQTPASHWRSKDALPFDDPIPFGDDLPPWNESEVA